MLIWLLSILECVVTVRNAFPTVTAVGLADDYRFVDPELDALAAAEMYSKLMTAAGHTFCAQKSKVWSQRVFNADYERHNDIARHLTVHEVC